MEQEMEDKSRTQAAPDHFDCSGYEVVRSEFLARADEPAITFGGQKMWVNTVCLKKLPDTTHILVLVNRRSKRLSLQPCREDTKDSLRWCTFRAGKRSPRYVACPFFFVKICQLMDWNPAYRYRMLGKYLQANSGQLLVFDLQTAEILPGGRQAPIFPAAWQEQFGLPAEEHRAQSFIRVFDEYAVFSLEEGGDLVWRKTERQNSIN